MADQPELPEFRADDFLRRFALRAQHLMWFLGAGASASAGVPTAADMIWDFKVALFSSQRRFSPKDLSDRSNPYIQSLVQAHIESSGSFPPNGADDEYAALFEAVYPSEIDRRTYLQGKIAGAKPSFGHVALGSLMRAGLTRMVWTTNFDRLVEDACAVVFEGTGALVTAGLGAPDVAGQAVREERWPIAVKLHGDYHSRRLKNTDEELRHQDAGLRALLSNCAQRFGMVVAGYSGRDSSVMDAMHQALEMPAAFPGGLFWLHRGEGLPAPSVRRLLARAVEGGVEAGLVRIESFDEILRDIARGVPSLDGKYLESFEAGRRRWTAAPIPMGSRGWPVIRLNAIAFEQVPTMCRRIVCSIGGSAEVRAAVKASGGEAVATRSRAGVLAFGSDTALRSIFGPFDIQDFSIQSMSSDSLRRDSAERGLVRDVFRVGLVRNRQLDCVPRRAVDLLAPKELQAALWGPLREQVGEIGGRVPGLEGVSWREGVCVRLDWANDRLWLLVEPRTVYFGTIVGQEPLLADFSRRRTVKRYNRVLNGLIEFWTRLIVGDGEPMTALSISDGVDAPFRLSAVNGYSRRARA